MTAQNNIDTKNQTNNNNNNIYKKVNVHSVLTMVSSTPVNPPGRRSPLTAVDRAMGDHNLHVIFYFQSGSVKFDEVRASLNEVLTLYPNVTGRLAKDSEGNWEVKFTDAGVRVYLAKVEGCSVNEWLRFADGDDEMHLTVSDDLPDDPQYWSPFRLQITHFEGGGSALALSCPHMLADPMTVTLLIKSWTDTHHRNQITNPPFLHPHALINPPKLDPTLASSIYHAPKSNKSNPNPSPKMGSATFNFSGLSIKQYLSELCHTLPDATPFDVLTALFWSRIARLKSAKTHDYSGHKIVICTDMRKRLSAPLPSGYFGNAMYFSDLTLANIDLDSDNLSRAAELVHRHVGGVIEEEFMSAIGLLESRKDEHGKCGNPFKMYGPELTCVNFEHMITLSEAQPLMYLASFDKDQKPAHVSYQLTNAEGEGLIFVMPSPEGGLARRVSVTLPEEEIRALIEDDVILRLKPTLLLSGSG